MRTVFSTSSPLLFAILVPAAASLSTCSSNAVCLQGSAGVNACECTAGAACPLASCSSNSDCSSEPGEPCCSPLHHCTVCGCFLDALPDASTECPTQTKCQEFPIDAGC